MRVSNAHRLAVLLAVAVLSLPLAFAQETATPPASTSSKPGTTDRLFLAFVQDAAIVPSQWWEGQLEYLNGSSDVPFDALIFRGVVAFQPIRNFEFGGSFGLGNTDADGNLNDGTGATDLNVFGKYLFGEAGQGLDFTAGLLATVPTGDDNVGLGFNAFSAQAFGAMRYDADGVVVGANVGVRFNGDGDFFEVPIDGDASFQLGVSVLFPMANQVTLTGEAQVETGRFDGFDSTANLAGGVNWQAFQRGLLRAAVIAGLTDATPNFQVLVGYAFAF
jgi:hypothetical protein